MIWKHLRPSLSVEGIRLNCSLISNNRALIRPYGSFFITEALSMAEVLVPLFAAETLPAHHYLIVMRLNWKTPLGWMCSRGLQSGAITNPQMITTSCVLLSAC